ncbi:MAG TPA: DoxX family protein [Mycobacteriales bacterium]
MSFGLLILRLLLAAMLCGHAAQKLLGWFGGAGLVNTAAGFERWGFRPGPRLVVLAGMCELLGAGSVVLGLLTPGGAAVIIGTMIVAAAPSAARGLWAHQGGCEVPVLYAGMGVVLGFTGPGGWSVDHALGLTSLSGPAWGAAAVVVGVLAAVPPLLARHRVLAASR